MATSFRPGSVLVKKFSIGGKRVETRFFWRDDESDADLVVDGTSPGVGTDASTSTFPSRAQCDQCHTRVAGSTLGPELAQLNHAIVYPATGRTANQLDTLWGVGILDIPDGAPSATSSSSAEGDALERPRRWKKRSRRSVRLGSWWPFLGHRCLFNTNGEEAMKIKSKVRAGLGVDGTHN